MNTNDSYMLLHNDGRRLLKIYKQGPKASFHKMEQCAKINGTPSILITKRFLIITKGFETILVFGFGV